MSPFLTTQLSMTNREETEQGIPGLFATYWKHEVWYHLHYVRLLDTLFTDLGLLLVRPGLSYSGIPLSRSYGSSHSGPLDVWGPCGMAHAWVLRASYRHFAENLIVSVILEK